MDIHTIRTNNFDSMCRLCLSTENNLISIFDETYTYLPQRIAACINVEVYKTDKIPTTICKSCLKKVEDWYIFKKSCDDCQSKLRLWSSVNNKSVNRIIEIKEEIQSGAEDEVQVIQDEITIVKEESISEEDYYSTQIGSNGTEFQDANLDASTDELHYSLLVPLYEKPATIHGIDAPVCAEYRGRQNKTSLTKNCRVCFKEFKNVSNRVRHEKTVHYISNTIIIENPEEPQTDSEPHVNIQLNSSDPSSSDINDIESNNVTIEQFAASLQLIHSTKINLNKTISEKHYIEFNRIINQMLLDLNCFLCGAHYESHKGILSHLSKVFKIQKYSCFTCGIAFPNRSQYMIHISNKFCDERKYLLQSEDNILKSFQHYQCIICEALHVHKKHFDQHFVNAHVTDNYPSSCDRCSTLFNTKDEYKDHLTMPCFYNMYCSICKVSNSNEEFSEHCKLHENDETEFSYDDFLNKEYDCRIKALKTETDTSVNKYSCSSCGDQFPTLDLWCEHQKLHSDNVFQCLQCSRVFATDQELYQHKSTHSTNNLKLKLYRCSDTNSYKAISEFSPSSSNFPQIKPNTEVSDNSNNLDNKQNLLKKHECKVCKKHYATLANLGNHKRRFHNSDLAVYKSNRRMTCRSCKKVFRNSISFSHHKQTCFRNNTNFFAVKEIKKEQDNFCQLNDNINHICTICNKSYLTERGLNVHIKNHKMHAVKNKEQSKLSVIADDRHICLICNKSLSTEKGLTYHYKIHVKNDNNKFECQVCQVVFSNMNLLVEHFKCHSAKIMQSIYTKDNNTKVIVNNPSLNTKIKQGTSSFTCNFCSMIFAKKLSLDAHIKTHLNGSNISYKCTFCPKVTLSSLELTKHVKMKHTLQIKSEKEYKNGNSQHRCNKCKKRFSSAGNLKRHIKTHTKKCANCPKVFKNDKMFMEHKKIHYNKCRLCPKTFSKMKSLLSHFSSCHSNNRLKPKIPIKNSLKNKAKIKPKKEYPFTCTECNKTFTKRSALNRHERGDHKEKRL